MLNLECLKNLVKPIWRMRPSMRMIAFMRMLRVALTPRGWLLKTRLSNGVIIHGKNSVGFGGQGIYIFKDMIEPEFQYLEQFLDTTRVFVDVGANTGIYSLKAAKHFNNTGIVIAIEPVPEILATLSDSVHANGFTNVRLRNLCVANYTGERRLWMNFQRPHSFSLFKTDDKAASVSVLTVSLDDLFRWEGLECLNYLKIDAEGAEQEILNGAKVVITTYRPIIQVETEKQDSTLESLNYQGFHAPLSSNIIYIPCEHPKIQVPERLGWMPIETEEGSEGIVC